MLEQNNEKKPKKYAGILAHPTSFPSPYGIGDLGKGAHLISHSQHLPVSHLSLISTTSGRKSYLSMRISQLCLTGIPRRSTMEHL